MVHLFRPGRSFCESTFFFARCTVFARPHSRAIIVLLFKHIARQIFCQLRKVQKKYRYHVFLYLQVVSSLFRPNSGTAVWRFCLPVSKNVILADNTTVILSFLVHLFGFCPLIFAAVCRTMELSNAEQHSLSTTAGKFLCSVQQNRKALSNKY